MSKRFYWLKMKNSFFDQHDVKIIEKHANGKEILLLYIKLLVESVSHEGELRFSEDVPYDENTIALLTDTDKAIVHEAFTILQSLKMMNIEDDGTIILKGISKMIGSEEASDNAQRQKLYRERKKAEKEDNSVTSPLCERNASVTQALRVTEERYTNVTNSNESIEIRDKSIEYRDIDKEKSIKEKTTRFLPPTLDEISSYCLERNNGIDPQRFFDFYQSKGWMVGKNKMKDWKAAVRNWETRSGTKSAPPSSSNPFTSSSNPFTELRRQEGYT